ncbi:hypothetical protein F3Y22_tig00110925pilonHSYRG00049 [Hibiscus syriacus]|uniref:Uncharacterized protein n=2 Tax=Hibiscus syriacus TaxID=106335 RepID=A0A6A2ZGB0_HIBSY|nr:hypothetical protein F3Y22_tig00110925pilonHSYRG00049 [Hibiscus syriacus]
MDMGLICSNSSSFNFKRKLLYRVPPTSCCVPPWTNLRFLDLSSNKLRGSLPVPPASIYYYRVSNNLLTGEISSIICNLPSISVLDISNNGFSGTLPPCLGTLSKSLTVLNLQNNFRCPIPQACEKGSQVKEIDLSQNQLKGHIPRSLASRVESSQGIMDFMVQPENQNPMSSPSCESLISPSVNLKFRFSSTKPYSMTMTEAGLVTKYEKIQDILVAIDLSSNRFEGGIPQDIQILKAVQFLNLSNDLLSGPIPSSLANLTQLEALDLSQNQLSGEIPQELTQLNFLGFFNVSGNQLNGPIPQGNSSAR